MPEYGPLISTAALASLIDAGGCRLLDCRFDLFAPERGRESYLAGHLPGAVYADLEHDLSGPITAVSGRHPLPAPAALAGRLGEWGIRNSDLVVAYDAGNGAMAARAWWLLRWIGHERVALLDGGHAAWIREGRRLSMAVTVRVPVVFDAATLRGRVATTAEVAAGVASGAGPLLVDAREAPRFRGEAEPIDAVAGHVPGAVNFPVSRSLEPDGRWRSAGGPSGGMAKGPRRRAGTPVDRDVRIRRNRLPSRRVCRSCGLSGADTLRRLVERVDPRPAAPGGNRAVNYAAEPASNLSGRQTLSSRGSGLRCGA